MNFFVIEVLIGGLLTGVLYSLVALGFVLIFKASGVFNFAQGAMCLFAALALVRLMEAMPTVLALIATAALMLALVYALDLGIPKDPLILFDGVVPGGILVNEFDLWAAVIAGLLVVVLAIFFQRTRIGRALRAVADDHQAALSVGIPLRHIWVIVWGVAGLVALVAGIIWGSKLGVQFSIALVALKALPVLMLGGLTSVPGAIVGGLLVGAGEKLSEVFLGPYFGGGIENWFAYVVALLVLLARPQGLFGERIIERV